MSTLFTSQERRQGKGVAAVLHAEDAEKEAVQGEHDAGVNENHGLLELGTTNARGPVGKTNGAESKHGVCVSMSAQECHGVTRYGT